MNFTTVDVETADPRRDSMCAIALVEVVNGRIFGGHRMLIRPPRRTSQFAAVHGLTWEMLARQPTFRAYWPTIRRVLMRADFIAAHNSGFDLSVLRACCARAGVAMPKLRVLDTVRLARAEWGLFPTRLPNVARYLGLRLRHHDELSDAKAVAGIVLAANPSRVLEIVSSESHVPRRTERGGRAPRRLATKRPRRRRR